MLMKLSNQTQSQNCKNIFTGVVHREAPLYKDLRELLRKTVEKYSDSPAYGFHEKPKGKTIIRSYSELYSDIRNIGTALQNSEFSLAENFFPEDEATELKRRRIAILGENSYNWILAINAALFSSDIVVPLDEQLPVREVQNLLERSKASILFLDAKKRDILDALLEKPLTLEHIVIMKPHPFNAKPESLISYVERAKASSVKLSSMQELYEAGAKSSESDLASFDAIKINPHAVSGIYFTSGTTSKSKGVMLSQANITANVRMVNESIGVKPQKNFLSILPLHHTFENAAHYSFWTIGSCQYINNGLRYLSSNLRDWKIEMMIAVPLILERIYKKIVMGAERSGKIKKLQRMIKFTNFLRKIKIDLRRPLYKKLREKFAPALEMVILGAAPMLPEVQKFFTSIGIENYLGYGMTECAPLISNNSNWENVIGSVGQPCARVSVRIDLDPESENNEGEIQVKSPGVMKGYYEDPEATKVTFTEDGWLRTGDIGRFDKNNCLHITGRLKSMIVLKNGKKAFPEDIESLIQDIEGVTGKLAFASETNEGDSEISILLQVDEEISQDNGMMQKLKERINQAIEHANQVMPSYKAIRYWAWTIDPFTMTTTLKIKRKETIERLENYLAEKNISMRDINMGEELIVLPQL